MPSAVLSNLLGYQRQGLRHMSIFGTDHVAHVACSAGDRSTCKMPTESCGITTHLEAILLIHVLWSGHGVSSPF